MPNIKPKNIIKRKMPKLKAYENKEIDNPYSHLDKVQEAIRTRNKFMEKLKTNNKLARTILYTIFGTKVIHISGYRIEPSTNSPAINLYVETYRTTTEGGITQILDIPKIGKVQFNIIYESPSNDDYIGSKIHEEEHSRSNLMVKNLKKMKEIKTIDDIKEKVREEILARISEATRGQININRHSEQHYYYFTETLIDLIILDFKKYFEIYLENTKLDKFKQNPARARIEKSIFDICLAIFNASEFLTTNEIMIVLRQNDFDNLIPALQNRVKLKKYYLAKKDK